MICPKCNKEISDNLTECPFCRKVLALKCPNCNNYSDSAVCKKCGYLILVKCSKCGRMVPTSKDKCKCGFDVKSSIAYQECEIDEFASLIIKFSALKKIRKLLGSQELFAKFYYKLNNLLIAQFKDLDAKIIQYNDVFVVNFNKELSFVTSVNKAIRTALKIVNAFSSLNKNILEELATPLDLNITAVKKDALDLLENSAQQSEVKLLNIKKQNQKFLKGFQVNLDQYCADCVSNDYKIDSLYSLEEDGKSVMYYEVLLDNYILPPDVSQDEENIINLKNNKIQKINSQKVDDIYSFKVFDINAKSKFYKVSAATLVEKLDDNKVISIRSEKNLQVPTQDLVEYFENTGKKVLRVSCTEELVFKPWNFYEALFRDYYNLSTSFAVDNNRNLTSFKLILGLINGEICKASTSEDARFAFMEEFSRFLSSLKNVVILVEGFEYLDDTSIQALELYFDKFKNIVPSFVFITSRTCPLHFKFKGLLRTSLYSEFVLEKADISVVLSKFKEDASDFIQSFYYEKILENFDGSLLYFKNALSYLIEKDVLINFENRLLVKNNISLILPKNLFELIKARLKNIGKNQDASLILAYSYYLGSRLDFKTLELLGIKEIGKNAKILQDMGLVSVVNEIVYINNYHILREALELSVKNDVEIYLCKNIVAKIGTIIDNSTLLIIFGKLGIFKEEYLLLWKNSKISMSVGDFDAYLKNCLGYLSLVENADLNIDKTDVEENKKEVYENILINLYNYSPAKIYSIENVLLKDAFESNDNEKILKLSNLMLQGALISANYTDASTLLHNILERMESPVLLINGILNSKFLLLSLVNIEILYNIGDYVQCVEVAKDLLAVLKPDVLEKIKPASFSLSLFVSHLLETFRMVAFAKLLLADNDLETFFDAVKFSLGVDLIDKDSIISIRDFLNGKDFVSTNVEESSSFSKVIYLLLHEFTELNGDYKNFAQNIYQAKLLACDIKQKQLELFCDLLIGYSYAQIGIGQKAESIYLDVLKTAESTSIYNIILLAKYFIILLKLSEQKETEALIMINDNLALLQANNNQPTVLYVLLEKLFIDVIKKQNISSMNIESEVQKLQIVTENSMLSRLLN